MTDKVSVEDNAELFKDAPDWANWIAMDNDDEVYWYESKPIALCFCSGEISWDSELNMVKCDIKMDCHWSHSLIERVSE